MSHDDEDADDMYRRRLRELHEEGESHPGLAARRRWQIWGVVVNALRVNQRELLALIDQPGSEPDMAIELVQNVRDTGVSEAYFAEMYRRLHNYVASVKTLVDHSRILVSEYEGSDFAATYEGQVQQLVDEPVTRFVQDLRNVFLHQTLPPISVNVAINNVNTDEAEQVFSLNFETDQLVHLDRLSSTAKRYVSERGGENIAVRTPVEEYGALVDALCDWTRDQFTELHRDEIADYNRIVSELRSMLPTLTAEDVSAARRVQDSPRDPRG